MTVDVPRDFFTFSTYAITRGHKYRLYKNRLTN